MAKLHQFQTSSGHIKTPNRLVVVVYDNLKDVRKWGRWNNGSPYGEDTFGVTNKQSLYSKDDELLKVEAFIRLDKTHCPTGLVAHEVAHAAVYLFTQDGNRLHKDSPISKEEKFCYLYGDLFHEVTKKMYKLGVWEQAES